MFRHLFKLIWNKKKQNLLLISEMLVSFLVIFAVFTLLVYDYDNYRKPMGIDYDNVWVVNYNNTFKTDNTDSLDQFYETLVQTIKSLPQIDAISFSSENIPFSQTQNVGGITLKNKRVGNINWYVVDDNYQKVLNMQILDGRWFNKGDAVAKDGPVVINADLKEKIFGKGKAVGEFIEDVDNKTKALVIGVVKPVKMKGDFSNTEPAIYNRTDTGSYRWLSEILLKVKPGADATFESQLYKILANSMKNSNVEIEHLDNKLKTANYWYLVPMIVLLIVAGFLIVNVALGLCGVLWYNISRRRGEIGLRRAIGASGKSVSAQLVGESMILASFSLIIGSFFAIQFPLLNVFDLASGVYLTAMVLSVLFIYLLVLICSLYPGKQAASIYPAVALHEE
ncbi:MAG TPA: ABC transporter permease [Puia sp.]|nr:ABC transporter permease [Puia sp.]